VRTLVCAVLLFVLAAPAHAGGDAEREARALFKDATRRVDAGDYVGALERYRSAYERYPNAKILLNIGTMLSLLGRNAEAADALEKYLDDPNADAKRKPEVQKQLAEVGRRVGRLRIAVEGRLTGLKLDSKPLAESAGEISVRVDPGSHTVVGERRGAEPIIRTIEIKAGEEQTVRLEAAPNGPAEPTAHPLVTPSSLAPVASQTPPGVTASAAPPAERSARPPRWLPWLTLAASVAAVAVGGYFAARSLDDSVSFADRSSAATGANIAFISGGALAVGSVGLWIWRAREP
jgi:hypothetical protein